MAIKANSGAGKQAGTGKYRKPVTMGQPGSNDTTATKNPVSANHMSKSGTTHTAKGNGRKLASKVKPAHGNSGNDSCPMC